MKTIEEKNKMIANYEGWVQVEGYPELMCFPDAETIYLERHIDEFNYHSSWDKLIPVAHKVKEELDKYYWNQKCSEKESLAMIELLNYAGSSYDITKIYPAVVEVIEFLNKQKEG